MERGIRVERADGALLRLISEADEIADADPTYGRNELLASDARWIAYRYTQATGDYGEQLVRAIRSSLSAVSRGVYYPRVYER